MTTKISVYSLSDLKSTLDDHLPLFLTSPNLGPLSVPLSKPLRFSQTHFHTTIRLALGYSSVALALYIFYLDYYLKVPWNDHKLVTAWAVLGYALLSAAMTVWIWSMERGMVFEGEREARAGELGRGKKGESVDGSEKDKASTSLRMYSLPPHRKYDPSYRLLIEWTKKGAQKTEEGKRELVSPFTAFFQADGTFVSGEFERWLRGQVPELLESKSENGAAVKEDGEVIVVDTSKGAATGSEVVEDTPGKKRAKKRG